ncbi:MAG: hypothetical protein R2932_59350 [Caldilineaceae bacterium]
MHYHFELVEEQRLAGQHPSKPYLASFFPMAVRRGTVRRGSAPPTELIFAEVFGAVPANCRLGSWGWRRAWCASISGPM